MPRKRNWKVSKAKEGDLHPKKRKLTDLTGDTGPLNSTKFDLDLGDTDLHPLRNNSNINILGDTDLHPIANNSNINILGDTDLHPIANNSNTTYVQIDSQNTYAGIDCQNTYAEIDCQNTYAGIDCQNRYAEIDCQNNGTNSSAQIECQNSHVKSCKLTNSQLLQRQVHPGDQNNTVSLSTTHQTVQDNGHLFNASFLKFGSFDQFDSNFQTCSRGKQCVCNCVVYLALASQNHNQSALDLDQILIIGDQVYSMTVDKLKKEGQFVNMLLNFNEIPDCIEVDGGKYRISKKNVFYGAAIQTGDAFMSMQEALTNSFKQTNSALVMIGAICSAVHFYEGQYYFFDSHSHSKSSLFDPLNDSGKSLIIGFTELHDLVNYMYSFYTSMHIDLSSQFEILPLSFSSMNILDTQLKNYFTDQKIKNDEQKCNSSVEPFSCRKSKSYMKQYMKNRRTNPLLRQKEKEKEKFLKKQARLDPVFRQKELERELSSKTKERIDPMFRRKERISELSSKKKARENPLLKNHIQEKELASKRKERLDPMFRQKEQEKELASKRKERLDPMFRQKEQERELCLKRRARIDPMFRQKEQERELSSKRKARIDPMFRKKERITELSSKKKARENPLLKNYIQEKELTSKRKARIDPIFRQKEKRKELAIKRKTRSDPYQLQKERLSKQNTRLIDRSKDRQINRKSKSQKRDNKDYVGHESLLKKQRTSGSTMSECIKKFEEKTANGPSYVCTSCHQTWFVDSVVNAFKAKIQFSHLLSSCFTNFISVDDKEWICHTCLSSIKKHKVPRLSLANKMGFPVKPKELDLYPLEERLVSLRIPFLQFRQLPRGGQLSVKGNVVNVPCDLQPTINSLPRTMNESGTISVKLKKKVGLKTCDFSENVRPLAVICGLHYLMRTSDMYIDSGLQIDKKWVEEIEKSENNEINDDNEDNENEEIPENTSDPNINEDSDKFSEVDETEVHMGNADTLLDEIIDESDPKCDKEYIFAPGEGQRPIGLYSDPDAEYMSFPTIFCGQKRPDNKERLIPVQYTDIVKWELRSIDRRAAQSVPNIFYKLKKIQLKNISDKVNLAIRRCKTDEKKWTAKEILNPSTVNQLVKLDEGYYIFRSLRNSPVYLEKRKKDVFAMIRQLGLPTWFGSFSSADTKWKDLLKILAKLNAGKDYNDEELENMTWQEKTKLVQKDPVTCSRFFDHRVQQFIKTILKSEHHPIGKVADYFYRVEFQQRGSPHIHILIWIENGPVYKHNSDEEIVSYIDKHVSCSLSSEDKDLINLQVHKHSKSCRKKGQAVCRFNFPLPPLRKTLILEPLEEEVQEYKNLYQQVQMKINSLHGLDNIENMTFDQFLKDILEISEDEYIKAIRSSLKGSKVFVARKPAEVRVNPYMKVVLSAWKANHDLQFVLDPYACAMYIVSYISKSQKGMSALLDQATKEARQGNLDLKRQVRHIGNYFTNSVETSAQEAVYLTLQIPLTKATRQVVFINTSPPDKRIFLLKQTSALEKLSPNSTDIESDNDIKRYSKRPKALENWCLADYVSQLEVKFPKKEEHLQSEDIEESDLTDSESEIDDGDSARKSAVKINITMKNGVTVRQRKSFRILRYVRFNKKTDSENFYRERLMLFYPWRCELSDLRGNHDTFEAMYRTVMRTVETKAKQYEHNVEELDRAQEQAENDSSEYDEVAPGTQQVELEDLSEGVTESEQYVYFNPDRPAEHRNYDIGQDIGVAGTSVEITNHAKRMREEQFLNLMRSLNLKQREFFQHIITWIKTKQEPLYAFLTGGAGVGKSVVVRAIYQGLLKHLSTVEGEDPDDIRILLCAPTGKAAYNINGLTIHNAFQIQPNKGLNQSMSSDILNTLRVKYRNLSVILIDEISMVGNRMFSLLESRLRKIKANNQTFGGVSLIAIGDFFQLKPVFDGWIFQDLDKGITSLAPNIWKDLFSMHELTQIMRQKDDIHFAEILNRLRENALTDNDLSVLNSRIISEKDLDYPSHAVHLFVENDLVDKFNVRFISNLNTEKVVVHSVDTVQADVSQSIKNKLINCLPKKQTDTANLAQEVELAVGMKYDLTANILVTDGLTNGSTCVTKLVEYKTNTSRPSIVWVRFDDEQIGRESREKYSHLYGKNIDRLWTPIFDIKRSFTYRYKTYERIQIPLRPAAGKTIHKSQGDTVDEVVVSLKSKCKAKIPHIHYVALSRVRSLQGLHIMDLNEDRITVADAVRQELGRLRSEAVLKLCYTPLYSLSENFLKIVFNNARSFHAHFEDVKADPSILNADIIGFAESRLLSTDTDETIALPGFHIAARIDQKQTNVATRPPHGLVMYVNNDCVVQRTSAYSTPNLEFIMADIISCSKGHVQVVHVYKAPHCKLQEFKEVVTTEIIPDIDLRHSNLAIMGDFNFDLHSGNENFLNFMEHTFRSKQIIMEATTNYGSTLDLCFLKVNPEIEVHSGTYEAYWSDHKVVHIAIDLIS